MKFNRIKPEKDNFTMVFEKLECLPRKETPIHIDIIDGEEIFTLPIDGVTYRILYTYDFDNIDKEYAIFTNNDIIIEEGVLTAYISEYIGVDKENAKLLQVEKEEEWEFVSSYLRTIREYNENDIEEEEE